MYTVLYAHGTLYCMHAYLQYVYIIVNMAGTPATVYQKSYTVQYLYKYTYCTYCIVCNVVVKISCMEIIFYSFIYYFIYFIYFLDCFVLFRLV